MQGNGFKIFLIVFFLGLCGWYLYPSVQNLMLSQRLDNLEGEELQQYEEENAGYIQQVREQSLSLGLDLLGGMHVTMEVRVGELIGELATNKDQAFNEVLSAARERAQNEDISIIQAFVQEFNQRDSEARLSRYFRNEQAGITRRSTNEEVQDYLVQQADDAVGRAMEIIRNRVDRYGVTEPSIQRQGTRRIVVEMPGIDDPERVRDLLEGTARLEFRLMAEPQRLAQAARDIVQYYEPDTSAAAEQPTDTPQDLPDAETDTAAEGTALTEADEEGTQLTGPDDPESGPQNPLLNVMQPMPRGESVVFGRVSSPDTAAANRLLSDPEVRDMIPEGIDLLWTANPVGNTQGGVEVYELVGVRSEFELSGEAITDATVQFDRRTNQPSVSMDMTSDGARTWARVTGANVGENIAIVLDGVVYSYPNVEERIVGGSSSITGLESREEAQDIVNVLKSGALPAPLDIVEERTVGPSLGAESTRAGFISVVIGLLAVAIFMIFYYRTAGVVADIALLLNIILILGILAAFNATLTLPGIAGIVLTIGMAVDANVLIFDRVREEQNTGKTLKAAVNAGYEKALSAILDANITTFFVGAILYSFGVGPIQGFAVTLMAGILSSLFTAIIVTRVIFDYMIGERRMSVSYG